MAAQFTPLMYYITLIEEEKGTLYYKSSVIAKIGLDYEK